MEAKVLYVLFVYGQAYSTHDEEWNARGAWYSLAEKCRENAKIIKFTECEELTV